MDVTIGLKSENGKIQVLKDYVLDEAELQRLRKDFEQYANCDLSILKSDIPKGGVYPCTYGRSEPRMLFLKFDEVVYIA